MIHIRGWPYFYRPILNYIKTAPIKSSFSAGADIPDPLSVRIPHKNPPTNLGSHKGGQLRDYERNCPGDKAANILAQIPSTLYQCVSRTKCPPTNLGGHKGGQLRDYSAGERNRPGDKAANISVGPRFLEKRR
ncbi:hypothetical protein CDAR_372511 [Caerostris darwini]|uniref:Uncharacterized protein n=1 Tax=Caerostris darwini TaxID=1538125 RepID=A0AAV4T9M6_9ARAC|nr:hypothetical protein CDAR_372511 [Caerostris darwini]